MRQPDPQTTNPNLITPCPVCGMEDDCPHTPIRCQHDWKEDDNFVRSRECVHCGLKQRQEVVWRIVHD